MVHSRVHKHQDPGGSEQVWWVSEPVVQAIKTAEQIALQPDRIFGSIRGGDIRDLRGFDVHDEIQRFIQWVNATAVDKGLEPISDVRIAPHRFRRTMAVITANEPDGEIALGITLKHNATRALANATTSGYGAPTAAWAREFGHEAQNATAAELVSEWSQHAEGQRISRGPGAAAFNTGLDHVTSQYAQSPAHIGLIPIKGVVGPWPSDVGSLLAMCLVRMRDPSALARRCSSRPLIAFDDPFDVPRRAVTRPLRRLVGQAHRVAVLRRAPSAIPAGPVVAGAGFGNVRRGLRGRVRGASQSNSWAPSVA